MLYSKNEMNNYNLHTDSPYDERGNRHPGLLPDKWKQREFPEHGDTIEPKPKPEISNDEHPMSRWGEPTTKWGW
jgi:hypothetical protein